MEKQIIFNYTDVCWMAFIEKCDLEILPEQGLVRFFKNGEFVKEYSEIGNTHFVLIESKEI